MPDLSGIIQVQQYQIVGGGLHLLEPLGGVLRQFDGIAFGRQRRLEAFTDIQLVVDCQTTLPLMDVVVGCKGCEGRFKRIRRASPLDTYHTRCLIWNVRRG